MMPRSPMMPRREHNLRFEHFPVRMRIVDNNTQEVLWEHIATAANAPTEVHVPGFPVGTTSVVCDFGDGSRLIALSGSDEVLHERSPDWPPTQEEKP